MKRLLKITGILLVLLVLGVIIAGSIAHEPLPKGKKGPEADALARKMLATLNHGAYQETKHLAWSFNNGAHTYAWDKNSNSCDVKWKDYTVQLNLQHPEQSMVHKAGREFNENTDDIIQKALAMFHNDSFWLVAPYKVFDPGTERRLVTLEDGTEALLVTYTSGGTTPGDSYLWLLNDNGFPNAFKMWVNIIPIGGIEASWDDWLVTESGAFLPKTHKLGPINLDMGPVRGR